MCSGVAAYGTALCHTTEKAWAGAVLITLSAVVVLIFYVFLGGSWTPELLCALYIDFYVAFSLPAPKIRLFVGLF